MCCEQFESMLTKAFLSLNGKMIVDAAYSMKQKVKLKSSSFSSDKFWCSDKMLACARAFVGHSADV